MALQQYLPLAVLKRHEFFFTFINLVSCNSTYRLRYWNESMPRAIPEINLKVATVLTACGIETQDD